MKKKIETRLLPLYISAFILLIFTVYFIAVGNFEFLLYTATLGLLIWLLGISDKKFLYFRSAKWGFAIWLFGHLGGGVFRINGQRLYDTVLVDLVGDPFFILRYDQAIHIFCYFVITLLIYSILLSVVKEKKTKMDRFVIGLIAFLGGMGVSAVNEIIEFATVVFFGSTGVGGYYNNAIDLVFNSIGALMAVFFMRNHSFRVPKADPPSAKS